MIPSRIILIKKGREVICGRLAVMPPLIYRNLLSLYLSQVSSIIFNCSRGELSIKESCRDFQELWSSLITHTGSGNINQVSYKPPKKHNIEQTAVESCSLPMALVM